MKKYWKRIVSIVAVLLVGLVIWFIFFYNYVPRLSEEEKEKVEQAYSDYQFGLWPIDWYDENDHIEEFGVWRYIGTYGDCYAFLVIGNGQGATMDPLPGPFEVYGLARSVYYPADADVVLYHTKRTFTYGIDTPHEFTTRLYFLEGISSNREEWITNEQWEQLTRDIEKLAREHN